MTRLHPEQRDDELYMGNTTEHAFERCSWWPRRMGESPVDDGNAFESSFPWFVSIGAVESAIRAEEATRGPNSDEKVRCYQQMIDDWRVKS